VDGAAGSTARCGVGVGCEGRGAEGAGEREAAAAKLRLGAVQGPRFSSIARLLGHNVRQQAAHRDRLNRAQPLSMFARTLQRRINFFKDLLEKMFVLDPTKRISVSNALSHPFF